MENFLSEKDKGKEIENQKKVKKLFNKDEKKEAKKLFKKDNQELKNKDILKELSKKRKSKYTANETISRAKSRKYEVEYNLIKNNCEHFCNWCRGTYLIK